MSVKLNHRVAGPEDGPPLVLLHGLFGHAINWQGIVRRLEDDVRVYALDLRNHGDSPQVATMSFPEMASDVCRFIVEHDIDSPVVLGHSLGGKVAMTLALMQPAKLSQLIVADVAPVAYRHDFSKIIGALSSVDLEAVENRRRADEVLAETLTDEELRAFLLTNLKREDDAWHWRINLDVIREDMDRLMSFPAPLLRRSFEKPALFIAGSQSDYLMPEHHARIRRTFPQARFESLEAGHWLHAEAPDEFAALVRDAMLE